MAERTGIEWTDATWNPWYGCRKVSQGCKNCYMYKDQTRYGRDPMKVQRATTTFHAPLKWAKPQRVFTCSWSDWFIEEADEWRDEAWEIIRRTPHLTYQILTKRIERAACCLPSDWSNGYPNVWLGVSAENQQRADERIPQLLQVPAAVRFVSYEPALGPIALRQNWRDWLEGWDTEAAHVCGGDPERCYRLCPEPVQVQTEKIDWVIAGGESGPGSRPMHPDWIRSLRDQCQAARVPFFYKQRVDNGRKISTPELDGRTWAEFPAAQGKGE